jgi:hypothetical protein
VKKIKLSGRERAVLRAIDFSLGTAGAEIAQRTCIHHEDLSDILNGLMEVGYVETNPPVDRVELDALESSVFEINPSYALDLREAIIRR